MAATVDTATVVDRLRARLELLTARVEQQGVGIAEQRARLNALERSPARIGADR